MDKIITKINHKRITKVKESKEHSHCKYNIYRITMGKK